MADRKQSRRFFTFAKDMVQSFFANNVTHSAAALTYYLLFAVFPLLLFIGSLLGFLKLPMLSLDTEQMGLLPTDIVAVINLTIAHMNETSNGTVLALGLVFTLWFPLRAVKNMMIFINRIYGYETLEHRPLRILLLTLGIIILIPLQTIVLIIGENFLNIITVFIPITEQFISLWTKAKYLPVGLALFILISGLYVASVNERLPWKYIFSGAFFSSLIWLIFSIGFSYYVNQMGRYSTIYGSIGAIIVFLVWLNASMTAILSGAVFNATLLKQK